ncbi:putative reverse transcriptase domain-containing protein [Tanacetum coccineum]
MYVGEGEALLCNTFHRARLVAPSIIFFDEADVVAAKRFNNLVWLLKVVKVVEVDAVEDVKEEDNHNDDDVDAYSDANEDDALQGRVQTLVCPIVNALAGRLLGVYDLEVATPRAVVHAGDKTSGDARSWYMINGDAKSWVKRMIVKIMPLRMTTRSIGRPAAASRGGGTGGRAGRGGGRTGGRSGDQGNGRIDGQGGQVGGEGSEVNDGVDGVPDFSTIIPQQLRNLLPTIVAQVGDQGRGQGNGRNQNDDAINDNIQGDVRNVIENNDCRGCTFKELLACNPKEYDGKGGAVVYTRWIEKMEPIRTLSREKLESELRNHAMVGAGHATYTDRFHELARLVPHLVTPENRRIERNGSIKKNPEKMGNGGEPSKDRNGSDDNKRTRTGNAFATTANHVRREYTGTTPKCTTCNFHHPPETPCRACFNCNRPRHFAKDCREVPRNVNPINAKNPTARASYECGSTDHIKAACPRLNQAQRPGGNYQNQVMAINGGQGHRNNGNQARIEPNDLGFSYEIEIGSEQLVEIDKVIKGCKLEIEGHVFDINLIPFGSGSFDVVIGMDWLSTHKVEIICHEKVVRIPLPDGKVLRVIGERPEEKMRHLRSAKTKEQNQEEIVVVRDYPEVFSDDLSGMPPNREIEFHIELVLRAIPVAKSPYRLAPSEMEELSGQLKELQDKGFIRPSSSPWRAYVLFVKKGWYGYIKNHKKTVKNRQARTRESVEYKAEARKVKPQSKSAKKSQTQKYKARVKSVFPRDSLAHSHEEATSAMVKAQGVWVFALNTLTQLAQAVTSKNDSLAIRVSVLLIQRLKSLIQ